MARPVRLDWPAVASFLLGLLSLLWWRHRQDARLLAQMDESEREG